ncbi:putative nad dependent epimerase dehydratase family protein [Phaeomoniella chlamydospora]|uniref:Putative nad dependent epimerase dehydratase family protein n=1 Tax=Phaeomoniella chlamydospora TaxID=158046 RepID=A0A0G2EJU5_PHACM|nr:putative nad dependent epimerase dehydratase family protein [Phaeomoniella chlamydospora]
MPRKVLVTGATGFLGRAVVDQFDLAGWFVTGTGFSRASPPKTLKVDLTIAEDVEEVLDDVKPEVIVHCAADRQPDSCSNNPSAAKAINVTATSILTSLSTRRSIFLIYLSTDYVFSGLPGEAPYSTTSTPSPTNVYGELKLEGEKVALSTASGNSANGSVIVLRVPVLYGKTEPIDNNKESAVNVLLDAVYKAAENPSANISMDDWALRYPTNVEDVGRVCKDIAEKYTSVSVEERTSLPKILHFSSEDKFTKYEICELLAEILGVSLDGMKANKEGNDPNSKAQRPYDAHLGTEELKSLGISVHTMDFKGWW